jgi:Ca-activated chloride channel family protein
MMAMPFDRLLAPEWLYALPLAAMVLLMEWFARPPGAISMSTGEELRAIAGNVHVWRRRLPALLRAAGLALLLMALARPVSAMRPQIDESEVVDIMLCVDVSRSMMAMDFRQSTRPRNRLEATKEAVRAFIEDRKQRSGDRFGIDRLGLILYAGYAWTQTPLTIDYKILERDLSLARIAVEGEKTGTAIGSAIGLAVSKLKDSAAESKVVVLLTDGRNNRGELGPVTAAQIARDYGIRIYTIGAGTGQTVLVPQNRLGGQALVPAQAPMDEEILMRISEITGGAYFRASDLEGLERAYREIDSMERTAIELTTTYTYEEAFLPWAIAGGLCALGGILLRRWRWEPAP